MDWISKINKELEERRERNNTPEAKQKAILKKNEWVASQGGDVSGNRYKGKFFKKWVEENPEKAFEQNSKIGKKQGKINVESGHLEKVCIVGGINASQLEYECEHCNKKVNGAVYFRWHGDNCKELQKIQTQIDIINMIKTDTFTSLDVRSLCNELNYNYKLIKYGLLKNSKYVQIIKVGTNQNNPSIFKKINP